MKKHGNKKSNHAERMELKYCEHCGSLWLRPSGAETVYCESCRPRVAELPPAKKTVGRVQLPVAKAAMVERYGAQEHFGEFDEEMDLEAAGGVA